MGGSTGGLSQCEESVTVKRDELYGRTRTCDCSFQFNLISAGSRSGEAPFDWPILSAASKLLLTNSEKQSACWSPGLISPPAAAESIRPVTDSVYRRATDRSLQHHAVTTTTFFR